MCVLAALDGGFHVIASLVVATSLFMFGFAFWLPKLRRIITLTVSGVALMVIAVSVMPAAMDKLGSLPTDTSPFTGLALGAATIATVGFLMLRDSALWKMMAIPITILVGCASAVLLGVYDFSHALQAP